MDKQMIEIIRAANDVITAWHDGLVTAAPQSTVGQAVLLTLEQELEYQGLRRRVVRPSEQAMFETRCAWGDPLCSKPGTTRSGDRWWCEQHYKQLIDQIEELEGQSGQG